MIITMFTSIHCMLFAMTLIPRSIVWVLGPLINEVLCSMVANYLMKFIEDGSIPPIAQWDIVLRFYIYQIY